MPSRPLLVSFVVHAVALVALAVVSVPPRHASHPMPAFLGMDPTEPCPDLDDTEPPDVELPAPAAPETVVEPGPEAEPEAAPPPEFQRQEVMDVDSLRGPARIPAVRIPPLRHREPPAAAATPAAVLP
ncbi:MAG: hypothetical protein L6Q95_13705, partial [Planctomycetes bacterium]|nr:hypothetical protein [Planctomycetota bacterium]